MVKSEIGEETEKQTLRRKLRELYRYHSKMEKRAITNDAKAYHKGAKRNILETMTLLSRGENTIWNSWCYKMEE